MKQFKNKVSGSSVHFFEQGGLHYYKITKKHEHLKTAKRIGPFKNEGDALLQVCMSTELNFINYSQVYP